MREAARDKRRRSGEQEEDSQTVSQPVDSSHPLSLFCVKKSAGQGRTNLGVGGRSVVVRLGVLWRSLDGLLIGLDGANKVTLPLERLRPWRDRCRRRCRHPSFASRPGHVIWAVDGTKEERRGSSVWKIYKGEIGLSQGKGNVEGQGMEM
jgi:hypothetical protein